MSTKPAAPRPESRLSRKVTTGAAVLVLLAGALRMLWPMLVRWDTLGFHDWDVAAAYRQVTTVSLLRYGELPFWHPWMCGGYPAFGFVEGATNLVSPYLPAYLSLDLGSAVRLEVLGTTLTGLGATYLLAGRFMRSVALRALVAVLFALNGRWGLQAATGHSWHLQYCYLPLALYFLDRAIGREPTPELTIPPAGATLGALRQASLAGMVLALMVYTGAIYPLPHAALVLTCYSLGLAVARRSGQPLMCLAVAGLSAVGLAAPKLFAALDTMTRAPRLVDSTETIGIGDLLVMLTDHHQQFNAFPVRVPAYNWHEWGIYVGWAPLALLLLGTLGTRGERESLVRTMGLVMGLLGLGAFHPWAPWSLLHQVPPFASQHVPSRFLQVMVLLLALSGAAVVARWVDPLVQRHRWADLALLLPVVAITADLTEVSSRPFAQSFWMQLPPGLVFAPTFEHWRAPGLRYPRSDWAAPVLLPMLANRGALACYGLPDSVHPAAVGRDEPGYRGALEVQEGSGTVELLSWSPNSAQIQVRGASPGAILIYNMNYDPGWTYSSTALTGSNGPFAYQGRVALRLSSGDSRVDLRYRPRTLPGAMAVLLLAAGTLILLWRTPLPPRPKEQV